MIEEGPLGQTGLRNDDKIKTLLVITITVIRTSMCFYDRVIAILLPLQRTLIWKAPVKLADSF